MAIAMDMARAIGPSFSVFALLLYFSLVKVPMFRQCAVLFFVPFVLSSVFLILLWCGAHSRRLLDQKAASDNVWWHIV